MQTALSKRAKIAWSILKRAQFYPQGQKSCNVLHNGHQLYVGFYPEGQRLSRFLKKGHILCAGFYQKGKNYTVS